MRWGQDWGAHPGCPEVGLGEITINLLEARLWITSGLADNPGAVKPLAARGESSSR